MGGSGWNYFAPYQDDIGLVLQTLQETVFSKGEFNNPYGGWNDSGGREAFDSIEQLLEECAEAGTHSILDIRSISASSSGIGHGSFFLEAAPLSSTLLTSFFGTAKPTHEQIVDRENEFDRFLDETANRGNWEGTYVIVYDGEQPSEVYFIGSSGD